MRQLAVVVVVALVACAGKSKRPPGNGSQQVYAKKMLVSWGMKANEAGDKIEVFLQTTDEAGGQQSFSLGAYKAPCKVIAPAAEMNALSGVGCPSVELHAVVSQTDVVVLKLDLSSGTKDPMARVELTRVTAPPGAAIEPGT